jgi:hypothetical protein
LADQKPCYNHPHRLVRTSCARCRTALCEECLTRRTDDVFARVVATDEKRPQPLFCARCVEELEALAAAEAYKRRPLYQRLRPTQAGVSRVAIYLVVVAVILVPLGLLVRNMAATVLTPEELARMKFGLVGTFQTPEGTDFLSQVYGGSFIHASRPSQPDHDPSRLIDTWATERLPGWRSKDASFPQEMIFALPRPLAINKVILRAHPAEPERTWVRDFEVLVSTQSADAGFAPVTRGTLDVQRARAALEPDARTLQRFEFGDTNAHWVMLRVLSNQGDDGYTSLGEFEVYWIPPNQRGQDRR